METTMLDKDSPIPLYYQIRTIIEEQIDSGRWKPGMKVPSERELCEQFQVSRITVRQALSALVQQGQLRRQQGLGTFVASPRIEQRLNRLTGFTQDIRGRGQRPGARILQKEIVPAAYPVARALKLEVSDPVVLLKRLRLSDDEPVAVETAHLPEAVCPGLLDEIVEDRSLYEVLTSKFDIIPKRAEQQVEAVVCPPAEANVLGVKKGAPMLHMHRVTYNSDNHPFEYTESFYRGDRYVFHVELRNGGKKRKPQS